MSRSRIAVAALLAAACLSVSASACLADDFAPPPWAPPGTPNPHAITAEWEFFTDTNPLAPDGALTDLTFGSGLAPGGNYAFVDGPGGVIWGPGDGDGEWTFPMGGTIHIELDNVLDLEPVKHIWLQVTHSTGASIGLDTLAGFNFAATGSSPDGPVVTPFDPTHTLITWNMFPNPPWEEFNLIVFEDGASIDEVVLDTISIPEPSTLALCAVSLSALAFVSFRRRRRR